ncbi:MAG: type II secretion system protein N [Gammaproteobacteria bacterium]
MTLRLAVSIPVLIISYGVFLIWNAPAAWLVAQARPQLNAAQVNLFDAGGSAWNGRAELAFQNTDLGQLHWQASPWHLLTGHIAADFSLSGQGLHIQSRINTGGGLTRLNKVEASGGLPSLAALLGLPGGLEGTLTAHLDEIVIGRNGLLQSATGRLEAHDAKLTQVGVDLGTLTLTLENEQNGIRGQLANRGGDLDLAGTLTLTPGGAYSLQATLYPHPGQNQLTDGLAAFLGAPDGAGRYHYNASGRLKP